MNFTNFQNLPNFPFFPNLDEAANDQVLLRDLSQQHLYPAAPPLEGIAAVVGEHVLFGHNKDAENVVGAPKKSYRGVRKRPREHWSAEIRDRIGRCRHCLGTFDMGGACLGRGDEEAEGGEGEDQL